MNWKMRLRDVESSNKALKRLKQYSADHVRFTTAESIVSRIKKHGGKF